MKEMTIYRPIPNKLRTLYDILDFYRTAVINKSTDRGSGS
jgi:hypothetical protein